MTTAAMTYAQTLEGIRGAIAAYSQALDDGRTDDVVATFCPDGVTDIQGWGTFKGHEALHDAYAQVKPQRPQRHVIINTLVTDWNENEAEAVSDLLVVQKGDSGWAIQLVGRYHDTFRNGAGVWRFQHRTLRFVD